MAVRYDEVEILRGGIKYDRPSKGSFALNMLRRHGAWEVRKGFGQLTQFDSLMTHNIPGVVAESGYTKHLGSYLLLTDFGHEQIISVFKSRAYTSEVANERAQIANIYVVSIYDVTTRERWEEPLYRHTSESGVRRNDVELRHGQYETNFDKDYQGWLVATSEETFSFTEVRDTVFFGSSATELYAYTPSTFRGNRRRFVAGAHMQKWAPPYCESSMIWRVTPSRGPDIGVYAYLTAAGVPSPQALTSWGGRLVIAGNDREVFFSQPDDPTAFIDFDFIVVPTERTITALAPMGQSIYIFTDTETFLYQPASRSGDPVANGGMEPVMVSESIGCVSQSCVTKTDNAVIWLSQHGVHLSGNPMEVQTVSGPIAPLFTDFITDPMTTFFPAVTAETGAINTRVPQRNSVITLNTVGASVAYSEHIESVLVTLPEENVTLCFTGGEWSLWSYESNTAEHGLSDVGAVRNITLPWPVARGESLFLVGSVETKVVVDQARYGGVTNVDDDTVSRSAYILEYGRGGAIDRSIDDEDYRTIAGKYISHRAATHALGNMLILGEWIPVEQQYKFTGTATGATAPNGESAPGAPSRTVLIPVYLVPDIMPATTYYMTRVRVRFFFDFTKWRPIFDDDTTSTDIDLIFPPERLGSAAGWVKRKCEDGAGNAVRNGLEINLDWQGTGVGHTFDPYMNLLPSKQNLLCYIPMRTIADADVSGMGIMQANTAPAGYVTDWVTTTSVTAGDVDGDALVWREWRFASVNKEDNVAQPVDWAYMSEDVGLPEDARVKGRGMCIRLLSHDVGTDHAGNQNWSQSIFNTMMAADMKTWSAQVVDYIGGVATFTKPVSIKTNLYPSVNAEFTVRDRVLDGTSTLRRPDFGASIIYGTETTTTYEANTYLIGDEQVDEIVTSESVKGNSVAAMIFGFMRNPAERLKFESVKFLYRIVGAARRRRGR